MEYGREDYEPYYYLWHLVAIGILEVETPQGGRGCPIIKRAIWNHPDLQNGRDVKVALIDMGVARCHPNLEDKSETNTQIDWEHALDLASHRYGARYTDVPTSRHIEERKEFLSGISTTLGSPNTEEQKILISLKDGKGVERYVSAYDQRYATHGTACAGLVCGTSYPDDQHGHQGNPIIYYGVDPYSKIVPITTSISPDPEQLIAAFLYAHSLGVDVILFPRDAADPVNTPQYSRLDKNEKMRHEESTSTKRAWALFRKIFIAVSKEIPIVCAAGNDARSSLIYPASLAEEAANGVIAVGAVSHNAYRSGIPIMDQV